MKLINGIILLLSIKTCKTHNKEISMRLMMKAFLSLAIFVAAFFSIQISAQDEFLEPYNPYFVGEIGSEWQFPSDHLPRGVSVGNLHFAFWNILNKNYLGHIESNNQGLRDSSILTDNVPINNKTKLTIRELTSIQIIFEMISHSTHPRSLIALEETHGDVITYLKKNLPKNWAIATPPDHPFSQDLYLYDTDIFDFIDMSAVKYHKNLPKTILTLVLQDKTSGITYRFLQSHIPGGANFETESGKFADEAMKQYNPNQITLLMGDMNASPNEIQSVLQKASIKAGLTKQPFQYVSINHPSHINTNLEASWFDNFFIYKPKMADKIHASQSPKELHTSIKPIYDLFKVHKIQSKK